MTTASMTRGRPFTSGDPRAAASRTSPRVGRPRSPEALRRLVLTSLGRDAEVIVARVRTLAAAGDQQAVLAAATLLAASMDRD